MSIPKIRLPDSITTLSANSRVIYNPATGTFPLPEAQSLSSEMTNGQQLHFIFDKYSANNEISRISYSDLSATNIESIRIAPNVEIKNKWTLSSKTNQTFLLNTQSIISADNIMHKAGADYTKTDTADNRAAHKASYAAINYEYYKTGVLGKIIDLSNLIYKQPRVPSYVGQIIYSNKLSTAAAVKAIYGGNSWQQLNFCFLAGQTARGNPEENTITKFGNLSARQFSPARYNALSALNSSGGYEYVSLNATNISPHAHKLKAEKAEFSLAWRGEFPSIDVGNTEKRYHSHVHGGSGVEATLKDAEKLTGKITGEETISTSRTWNTITLDSSIYDSYGNRKITNPKHNNMPPFETVYAWRRTS